MIKRFLDLFRRRRGVPVNELPGYISQAKEAETIAALKAGEPIILQGGARLVSYDQP